MSESTYDLIFRGELLPEADANTVREHIGRLLKLDSVRLEQLFSGANVVLRRGADRETAARFQNAFRQAGARLRVMPVVASEPADEAAASADAAPVPSDPVQPAAPRQEAGKKMSLAERLAAQAHEAQQSAAPAAPGAIAVSAGKLLRATDDIEAPDFDLAPVGADLIDEDEREIRPEAMVAIEHIALAPPGGLIPNLVDRAAIAATVTAPDLVVAEVGADLGEVTEFVALPLDLSAFSLAEPGTALATPRPAATSAVRTDHLSLAPPGAALNSPG